MKLPAILLFSAVIALSRTAHAEIPIPDGGARLAGDVAMKAYADPAYGSAKALPEGAWEIKMTRADEARAYTSQVSLDLQGQELGVGDIVLVIVKARASSGGAASVEAKLQMAGPPYTSAADPAALELGAAWQEYPVTFRITTALPKGSGTLALLCGGKVQAVEIAAIRAYKYPAGTDPSAFPRIRRTYEGREPDAPWRKAALERIEKHRKSDFSVQVLDADGKPFAGKKIRVKLRRHEFGFGSAVTAEHLTADSEDGRRYREIVDRYFSQVVFENDLKDFGWEAGASGKEEHLKRLDQAMAWLGERHISIRGHYLMQVATPPNLTDVSDPEQIRSHFIDTTRERIAFAKDKVCEWDVINHPVAWNGADLLIRRPGLEKLDREIYKLAEQLSPLPLYVNEDQIFRPGRQSDETFAYIEQLKKDGFRVDGLGNQAHIDESFLPTPDHVLAVTDRFATLVPHQVITEFDIVTNNDEDLAADYTRDLMISCFSHPAYQGFLFWGFWEGRHWKPEAASWTQDWNIRKRGKMIEEWIGGKWDTDVAVTTDENGYARWKGYGGSYEVGNKAGKSGTHVSLTGKQKSAVIRMDIKSD